MQHTIQYQLTAAQEQSREEAHLQYAEWIRQGETKGLKGLFRSLKASELSGNGHTEMSQLQIACATDSMHGKRFGDNQVMPRPSIHQEAKAQAAQLPPLTFGQLAKTLKKLPDRACGPDAITTQLLRTAPKQALTPLLKLLQDMEATAELPTQLQMSLVVMLAENEKVERPITLTSVLYRTWCKMRKNLMDQWQTNLPHEMDYDRARPGQQHCMSHWRD